LASDLLAPCRSADADLAILCAQRRFSFDARVIATATDARSSCFTDYDALTAQMFRLMRRVLCVPRYFFLCSASHPLSACYRYHIDLIFSFLFDILIFFSPRAQNITRAFSIDAFLLSGFAASYYFLRCSTALYYAIEDIDI